MYDTINLDVVLARLKKMKGFATNKEVAKIFGISEPDFSRRKKKGTLLPLVIAWALGNQVNIDWLLTGRSSKAGQADFPDGVREAEGGYGPLDNGLLRAIIEAVENDLNHRGLMLAPGKKAQAIALLYEFCLGGSRPLDSATVGRYLDLASGP